MKVIDLSKIIHDEMELYEGDPEVEIDLVHTYDNNTWELRKISMGSHSGTHVDSFSHMHLGMKSIDEIPLERFFGRSQVVDLDGKWEKDMGLFFTENIGIEYLDKILDANPKFVGGNISEDLERALLKNEILTYTDLINLDMIPKNKSFIFYGLPLKIKSGDGSPVRAMAIID